MAFKFLAKRQFNLIDSLTMGLAMFAWAKSEYVVWLVILIVGSTLSVAIEDLSKE